MLEDFVGFGALGEALQALSGENYRKILVVASRSGWERFNEKERRSFFAEREMELFSDFTVNPQLFEILAGVERYRSFEPDLIVAVGGGSPIDVAKTIKAAANTEVPFDAQAPDIKVSGEGPPLVAIATTSGSGSEATPYAVFYVGMTKYSLAHPSIRPEVAVVDPELTYSMPPYQTASTGFDALSQSVEAFWASASVPEARELASASIGYALPNIYNAVRHPDPGSRYHMANAAYLSGKAISFTRTTLPHALAYYITKAYGLPHGYAVALTLPSFFVINLDRSLEVVAPYGREQLDRNMEQLIALMGQKTPEDCIEFWRNLMRACDLPPTLKEAGLDTVEKIRTLTESMNVERMLNHPVRVSKEYLVDFFIKHG